MATVVTDQTFAELTSSAPVVVVDFWAPWCTSCHRFRPIFADVAARVQDVQFATVNTDEQQDLAAIMGIQSLPTVVAFRHGKYVFAQAGVPTRRQLTHIVEQVKMIDSQSSSDPVE